MQATSGLLNAKTRPYRILKPYIRRDFDALPLRLRLHRELLERVSRLGLAAEDDLPREQHPVDFCYLQLQHVGAVNRLARDFFWPGIDGMALLKLLCSNYLT
jgi:hypothetical protein